MDTSTEQSSTASDAQFDSLAGAAAAAADANAASNIQSLGLIHQARTARLARNVTNLTALHGATSPLVVAAQAAHASAETIATRVELVRRQAVAVAPTVTSTGWAVWGHVYQFPATPLNGYTVFLVDTQKTYQSQYGFATTDADGSFALIYDGNPAASATKSDAPTPATEQSAEPAIPTLFFSVTNSKAQLVPTGTATPLALAAGKAVYLDITLAAGETPADLPPEVRKTAQPPTRKKKT